MTLSNKINCFKGIDDLTYYGFKTKDVKQAIKEELDLMEEFGFICDCNLCKSFLEERQKLFGDKLI